MADNVLGTLFGDIANAIRSKTGEPDTAKMKPIDFPTKILGIEVGGGATVEDIIPEQEFTFTYDETNGVHILTGNSLYNITDIITGKEYEVVWGTNEFSCTAFESTFFGYPCVAIGNPVSLGGGSNDIPFTILHVVSDDPEVNKVCYVIGLDGSASKRVRVYHEVGNGALDGWETVVEEQTATASYDSITLSNHLNVSAKFDIYMQTRRYGLFKVWFDGEVYAVACFNYTYTFSKEVLGLTTVQNDIIGNPTLIKGRMLTSMTCNSKDSFTEPFAIDVGFSTATWSIAVNDTNPHTIRVDYLPRGRM